MSVNTYRVCPDCKRQIADAVFDTASAHAPGCKQRRSLLAKEARAAKLQRQERAQRAAATRRANEAGRISDGS